MLDKFYEWWYMVAARRAAGGGQPEPPLEKVGGKGGHIMRWRVIAVAVPFVAVGLVTAVVLAQLGDTQTASGTVNVSTTSADLYICEPDSTTGPECGSDDSGADEAVFETLEDIRPAQTREWDVRLKNVGTEDWLVSAVTVTIVETIDPGADCADDALQAVEYTNYPLEGSTPGVVVLGKNGDPFNDNPDPDLPEVEGFPFFATYWLMSTTTIKVAPGDYEDVRLQLQLAGAGTENCDGNQWNVSWQFTVQ